MHQQPGVVKHDLTLGQQESRPRVEENGAHGGRPSVSTAGWWGMRIRQPPENRRSAKRQPATLRRCGTMPFAEVSP